MTNNKTPEQIARDRIDKMLKEAGWEVQPKDKKNLYAAKGVAVMEQQTSAGFADYALYVNEEPVGIIEAKAESEGVQLVNKVENQSYSYAQAKFKHLDNAPVPYVYESTGLVTRFTNYDDVKARSRLVFSFHRPETFEVLQRKGKANTLRNHLKRMPSLMTDGLRPAQIVAVNNLEQSFGQNRPKALIQMATGAGKTFTACTFVYRLLKHAKAKRILFLVDTKNLGEQAEAEFQAYQPKDDNLKFKELYNIQRLTSSFIASDSHVCISTIQRLYSILKGEELESSAEEESNYEKEWERKEQPPVVYHEKYPIETFDFIIVDECHRSIYDIWSQVLEYFDSFIIGLTATPDNRTLGYFDENLVSDYTYEESVIDNVNVPFDEYLIQTHITTQGETRIQAQQNIKFREKLSRVERWSVNDEVINYRPSQLDKEVVNKSTIRKIIREFKRVVENTIFPNRRYEDGSYEMPKSLIFAKTDSHADDIIKIVREEFGEGNEFCKKITDGARKGVDKEDPKNTLNRFRNSWNPRIAVTVDMIATGTDVKPLEILLFMRNVKSDNYFEQMKGRGCRTIPFDDLQKVTRTAKYTKDHFVLVDAVGVTLNRKTTSRSFSSSKKKSVPLKELLNAVNAGDKSEELFTTLADRFIRMEKQLTEEDKQIIQEKAGGVPLNVIAKKLLQAYDPDVIAERVEILQQKYLTEDKTADDFDKDAAIKKVQKELIRDVAKHFTGEFNELVEGIRRAHEQVIDTVNLDRITRSEWSGISQDKAQEDVRQFTAYIEEHKDELQAISFFYQQPYQRRGLTQKIVKDLLQHLKLNKPNLAPLNVWKAYEQMEDVKGDPINELTALVALVRRVTKVDETLTTFDATVNKNFQDWIFKQNAGQANRYSSEQMDWLRMIKNHISNSFDMQTDDLDIAPFDAHGGALKMKKLFGKERNTIINELNMALVA